MEPFSYQAVNTFNLIKTIYNNFLNVTKLNFNVINFFSIMTFRPLARINTLDCESQLE